ncbi:MAG TPA: hypothetical protein VHI93_08440, partial [Candidatus Thermoplasmatota archaeon]|nr:hypothetical protein [Candidatus Thermoplasmatota archaeon]
MAMVLLLSGCAGLSDPSPTPTGPSGPGTADLAKPQVLRDTGTVTAGVGVGLSLTFGAPGVGPSVKDNVTLMHIELRWSGPADLNLCIHKPSSGSTGAASNCEAGGDGGAPGMPDSPLRITIPSPEKGAWTISPYANGAAAQTDYELAVTL